MYIGLSLLFLFLYLSLPSLASLISIYKGKSNPPTTSFQHTLPHLLQRSSPASLITSHQGKNDLPTNSFQQIKGNHTSPISDLTTASTPENRTIYAYTYLLTSHHPPTASLLRRITLSQIRLSIAHLRHHPRPCSSVREEKRHGLLASVHVHNVHVGLITYHLYSHP